MPSTTSSHGSEPALEAPSGSVITVDETPHGAETPRGALCRRVGHRFEDPALLDLALRHRSWCAEHGGVASNERLEFLGDAVLGLVVTDHLFQVSPRSSEGVLARRRSELVSANALADVARSVGLGEVLMLGKGEQSTGGRQKTSILADAMEGVIGAVYLDGGIDAARRMVLGLLDERIDGVLAGDVESDHKSRLQEMAARHFGELPTYEISEAGPEHAKSFHAIVRFDGRVWGGGDGRTKKEAEQAAASEATARLAHELASNEADRGEAVRDA
ncbi:MAG: ribonuclease III [Actinobacteria bacterium]|nr:ribonuclease III [Actinomycetota bacterium]